MARILLQCVSLLVLLALAHGRENVALNQPAGHVHQWGGYTPGRAVDGNSNSNFNLGFCSTTNHGPNPWWYVDLGSSKTILEVIITNRGDCCPGRGRLHDFTVYLTQSQPSVSSPPSVAGSSVCYQFDGKATMGEVIERECVAGGATGRYLVVQILDANPASILTLCEVEAYTELRVPRGPNLALNRPAGQVHQWGAGTPNKAVDGNANTNYNVGYCSTTNHGPDPWWYVDLGDTYTVNEVVITNRADCCPGRLHDFAVYLTEDQPSTATPPNYRSRSNGFCFEYWGAAGLGEVTERTCEEGASGRYLVVQIMDNNAASILTLCEVEVYGVAGAGPGECGDVQAALMECEQSLAELTPVMPTAAPEAVVSDTAHKKILEINGIEYLVETTPQHVALKADTFCQQYGMKLAQVENQQTLDALASWFTRLQDDGVTITEVATGERSSVNLNRDVAIEAFNAAGWSCVTIVPDGSSFKLVSRKCQGERSILCAAVPVYC